MIRQLTTCHLINNENLIPSINAHAWNLRKWHWWSYLQGRNRDTDLEKDLWAGAGGHMGVTVMHGRHPAWSGRPSRSCRGARRAQRRSRVTYGLEGWDWGEASQGKDVWVLMFMHAVLQQKQVQHYKAIILQLLIKLLKLNIWKITNIIILKA